MAFARVVQMSFFLWWWKSPIEGPSGPVRDTVLGSQDPNVGATMKILRDDEMPAEPGLNEHRETDWRGLAFGLLLTPVALGIMAAPWIEGGALPGWGLALALGLGLLMTIFPYFGFRSYFGSRRPEAWRLRWSPEGIYLRFRSYHNWRFPADMPTVFYLPRREVAWLRLQSASLDKPDETGAWGHQRLKTKGLEIGLKNLDPAPLADALRAERQQRHRGFRVNDEPVKLTADGSLTVELRRAGQLLDQMTRYYATGLEEHRDGKTFADMSQSEREDHILALAGAGDKFAAIKAAREVFGYDLTKAKRLVEELTDR